VAGAERDHRVRVVARERPQSRRVGRGRHRSTGGRPPPDR
jgi:hypothetical protein